MTTKRPEKWTQDGSWFRTHDGGRYYAGGAAEAKAFTESANDAMDQAYRAGLESGRAEAKAAQPEPAPEPPAVRDMTDVEKAVWGQVYAAMVPAFMAADDSQDKAREFAEREADAAILAMRERCWQSADFRVMAESEAGVLEVRSNGWNYTRADIVTYRIEAGRDEATKAERERCAGIAKDYQFSMIGGNILDRILNPT